MFAVIETGGKQYKVEQGDVIFVEKLDAEDGATVEFDVVAVATDDGIKAGTPYVDGAKVSAEVLKTGKLWGAALDVTQPEPLPADHPLWDTPNLIITPHLAGGIRFEITRRTCVTMALDNLKRYLQGEPLSNLVKV